MTTALSIIVLLQFVWIGWLGVALLRSKAERAEMRLAIAQWQARHELALLQIHYRAVLPEGWKALAAKAEARFERAAAGAPAPMPEPDAAPGYGETGDTYLDGEAL